MALTNKGSKWETKNSLYIIMAFFPILNSISFFYMANRIKNKKWTIIGWLTLIIQILLIVTLMLVPSIDNPVQVDKTNEPQVEDYLGYNYYEEYGFDYDKQPEYANYLEDHSKWEKIPEIAQQLEREERFDNILYAVPNVVMLIGAMIWLIVLVVAFIERANFIKLLANQSNKIQLQDRLKDTSLNKVEISNKQSSKNNIDSSTITKEKIDVNSATEDELLKLGITIIDAKKAIAYREENDGFKSTNEFFEVINAKPHIIARLETLIDISEVKPVEKEKASNGKRRIDL